MDQLSSHLIRLKAHNLTFLVELPASTPAPAAGVFVNSLATQVTAHLTSSGFFLPGRPGNHSTTDGTIPFQDQPWVLMEGRRHGRAKAFTVAPHTTVSANNFDQKLITSLDAKMPNPDVNHPKVPLIVLGTYIQNFRILQS